MYNSELGLLTDPSWTMMIIIELRTILPSVAKTRIRRDAQSLEAKQGKQLSYCGPRSSELNIVVMGHGKERYTANIKQSAISKPRRNSELTD